MNRNMQPKIYRSATTYSVQNSISDTLLQWTPRLRQRKRGTAVTSILLQVNFARNLS